MAIFVKLQQENLTRRETHNATQHRRARENICNCDLLAGLLEHGKVVHHGEEVGLGGLDLLGHVVEEVHAGLVGPDVAELREAGDLHTSSVTSVPALKIE